MVTLSVVVQEISLIFLVPTLTLNVLLYSLFQQSGGRGAAHEAEKLLSKMHTLYERGDKDVKPSVVTYGAVIDSHAKSAEKGSAARADTLLAHMIQLYQSDPVKHADMLPNTYVFNTVINALSKSREHDAAAKAEEMLVAMSRLHSSGIPNLKPDAFTYTAVIDSWSKSGHRGAASRADQLLDKMEAKYLAGDNDLKPNTFTYNAVICALAKSGEVNAAARAERVLQNMVNRYRAGGSDDVKPTTINFNVSHLMERGKHGRILHCGFLLYLTHRVPCLFFRLCWMLGLRAREAGLQPRGQKKSLNGWIVCTREATLM